MEACKSIGCGTVFSLTCMLILSVVVAFGYIEMGAAQWLSAFLFVLGAAWSGLLLSGKWNCSGWICGVLSGTAHTGVFALLAVGLCQGINLWPHGIFLMIGCTAAGMAASLFERNRKGRRRGRKKRR